MATSQPHPQAQLLRRSLSTSRKVFERIVELVLMLCGVFSIVVTVGIAIVVIYGSVEFFLNDDVVNEQNYFLRLRDLSAGEVLERVRYFFLGDIYYDEANQRWVWDAQWTAGFANPKYCILPLLAGTFLVALIAGLIALPIGLATAIYLSEYATPRARAVAKPTLELLAGIPTVVYGFFAVTTITPFLALFIPGLGDPTNQLAGGVVVGIMIIPMVASLSEDALRAVPRSLRDGAIALGANKFETSVKVVLPAALSGVTASFLLAISRAIGETMAVSLACGDTSRFSLDPREGIATMTSFIVRVAKGDVPHGTTTFNSLFAVAGLLFVLTLGMNILAQKVMKRYRQVYQ